MLIVRSQFRNNLVQEAAAGLQEHLGSVRGEFESRYGAYPALQRIERIVTTQCRRIAKR
ncbi:MAG: hypothetical protein ACYDDO_04895 [Acidiferrobacterales bacterium]